METSTTRAVTWSVGRQEHYLDRRFRALHRGQACIVVAGGASVAAVDITKYLPCKLIAVNVVNYVPSMEHIRAHVVAGVILDENLLRTHLRALVSACKYPLFTGNTASDSDALFGYLHDLGIFRIPTNYTAGLGDTFSRFSNGGNSGFAAIQLAVIMGFTTIGLLGFDGVIAGEKRWFHSEYADRWTDDAELMRWCYYLDECAPLFRWMGVTVVNLSFASRLCAYLKLSPSGWRELIEGGGQQYAPQHQVRVPFRACRLRDRGKTTGYCYGGASNTTRGEAYSPIPSVFESCAIIPSGAQSILSSEKPVALDVNKQSELSNEEVLGVVQRYCITELPPPVREWLVAGAKRYGDDSSVVELPQWILASDSPVEPRSVCASFSRMPLGKLCNVVSYLDRVARRVFCAFELAPGTDRSDKDEMLAVIGGSWEIEEHVVLCGWLLIVKR
jgi:hypothetical protein